MPTAETEVVAGLAFREGKVLVGKRPEHLSMGGYWIFPGGKVKQGETQEAALIREYKEEVGLDIEVGARVGEGRHQDRHRRIHVTFYLCRLGEGEPLLQQSEISEVRWLGPEDILKYRFAPADKAILENIAKGQIKG